MKLFENGVGRPSNEIKKKRKIFIASIVIGVIALFAGCLVLFSLRTEKLSGTAKNGTGWFMMNIYNNDVSIYKSNGNCKIKIPIKLTNNFAKDIKIKSASIYYIGENPLQTVSLNKILYGSTEEWIYPEFDIKKLTSATRTDFKVTLWFTVAGESHTYYKYDLYYANGKILNEIKSCKNFTTTKGTTRATYANGRLKPTTTTKKSTNTIRKTQSKKTFKLNCPSQVYVGKEGKCTSDTSGVKISLSTANLNSAYKSSYTTTKLDKTKVFKYNKTGTITVKATKDGYDTVEKKVNIISSKNSGSNTTKKSNNVSKTTKKVTTKRDGLEIICPKLAYVNEEFSCYTNLVGTKIAVKTSNGAKIGGKSVTGSNITGLSYTTTAIDKTRQLKSTKVGKVTVTASKSGYKSVSKTINIVKQGSVKESSTAINLNCPSSVYALEELWCSTDLTGAKITITDQDGKVLKESTTSKTLRAISFLPPKANTKITVTAKKGDATVTKEIKVLGSSTGITLDCPTSAKVNKQFKCTTNKSGITISVKSYNLAKGYTKSFKTTKDAKVKLLKYTKKGTITVSACDKNYDCVIKKVSIK